MHALLFLVLAPALAAPPPDPPRDAADADTIRPDPAWKALGTSLWFDPKGRRLIVRARVVLREGPLEHLLCLKGTKEHEAILATDAVPCQIHAGLLLTGAEPGHPVRFLPKFEPPTGDPIAIELEWRQDGKTHHADAREWVRDERAKTTLKHRLGLRRQRAVRGPRDQEAGLRRRRRRPDHRGQLRQRDPRPPLRQHRQRRRPPLRRQHRPHPPPRHHRLPAAEAPRRDPSRSRSPAEIEPRLRATKPARANVDFVA